jgi:hypothetical protein
MRRSHRRRGVSEEELTSSALEIHSIQSPASASRDVEVSRLKVVDPALRTNRHQSWRQI